LNFILDAGWEGSSANTNEVLVDFTIDVISQKENSLISRTTISDVVFQVRNRLDVKYVPVSYNPPEGQETEPNAELISQSHTGLLSRVLPGEMDYLPLGGAPVTEIEVNPIVYESDEWKTLVRSLARARLSVDANSRPDLLVGWLPNNITISGPSGQTWYGVSGDGVRTPVVVANNTHFRTLAHESAHSLGLGHTPCGVTDWTDEWPYATATIQEYGLNVVDESVLSDTAPDLMSYCGDGWAGDNNPSWISPYGYKVLFDSSLMMPQPSASVYDAPEQALLVSGVIRRNGTVLWDPFYLLPTSISVPIPGSDYCLEFEDDLGAVLSSYCFDLDFIDDHFLQDKDSESFVWVFPYPPDSKRIVLRQESTVLGQVAVSPHAPTITITAPLEGDSWVGQQSVSWVSKDADDDLVTHRVFYSADNGQTWTPLSPDVQGTTLDLNTDDLAGGVNARIRVAASDGINTTLAEVGSLTVANKGPKAFIVSPADEEVVLPGTPFVLTGYAYDLEDGTLEGRALEWFSDKDGSLGTGTQIITHLSPGTHTITLVVSDGQGLTDTSAISIRSAHAVFLPMSFK
jgi:hypothetical protein